MTVTSAVRLYTEGLRAVSAGREHTVRWCRQDGWSAPLALHAWHATSLPGDAGLLDRCAGPTLDAGCGPGRLAAELAARGTAVLAVDVVPAAVSSARRRGAAALRRSVFDRLPGEGRWTAVLLADGNVGIGGDPERLLRRAAALIGRAGQVLVELDPPGDTRTVRVRLEDGARHSEWFDWAHVGVDAVPDVATAAGLVIRDQWTDTGRWFAALVKP